MFFDGWNGLVRVLVVGAMAYIALIVLLRLSGKRTLTKLNAFDLVVTVALGSTLATVLLSGSVALAEGLLALLLLVVLQFVITWLSVRSRPIRAVVKSEPRLLLRDGAFLDDALQEERITRDEVLAALRGAGLQDRGQAVAVVLETDGSLSVLSRSGRGPSLGSTLSNVREG